MQTSSTDSPAIQMVGVTKRFPGNDQAAVDGLDLAVPRGSIVALIGPSGCGKTTTLRLINRLLEPTAGRILIGGRDIRSVDPIVLRLGIGYVIQAVGLFPHRRIVDNIAVVPRALGWDRSRIRARIQELIEVLGLDPELLDRYPDELSGGQQQRVGVARALAADPPILLMDEPFGAVDPLVRSRLQDELLQLQDRLRKTIVIVTHDLDEAVLLADRVALFDRGGRLAQFATPDELLRAPADAYVTEFLGSEPSLRRLTLRRIGSIALDRGPVVAMGASHAVARRDLGDDASDWVGVLDGERFVGWIARSTLQGEGVVTTAQVRPHAAALGRSSDLRAAMDRILAEPSGAAVVEDDGRYLGLVTLSVIRAALAGSTP